MQLEVFHGSELRLVVKQVRTVLGEDAMIVRTRVLQRPDGKMVEIIAARPEYIEDFRRRLATGSTPLAVDERRVRARLRPHMIALVGPAGTGKTTTAVKLALHPRGLGSSSVGILTLDTVRVGALEEIHTYAEVAELQLEVAYNAMDAHGALQRMRDLDFILVDCPGRGFGGGAMEWAKILGAIAPEEIHLVVPASWRPDLGAALRRAVPGVRPTHALFTKLDEVEADAGFVALVEALDLPTRWVADGPEIPGGLSPASGRILAALGVSSDEARLQRLAG